MITVTGSLQDLSGGAVNNGSLLMQLCGVGGALPRVAGTAMLAQSGPKEIDCPTGTFSFQIYGNDVITPAGTFYTVQVLDPNGNVVQVGAYQFSGGGSQDLSTVAPYVPVAVVTPPVTINGNLAVFSFSATPAFDGSAATGFELTLTGNVTAPTMTNVHVGAIYTFVIIQDSVGGRTFAWPANVVNATVPDATPFAISVQAFIARANGNLYPTGPMTIN